MGSIFDDPLGFTNKASYDNFFGLGGEQHPNGGKKSRKSGYCGHCERSHSVDFVHDVVMPVVGVGVGLSLLGFAFNSLGGLVGGAD